LEEVLTVQEDVRRMRADLEEGLSVDSAETPDYFGSGPGRQDVNA
jgi:hypothetical protein